ncbi:MAG: HD domain-containing protein [candidate division NC10 bacterium]|nr:HD domain-containing protein [candidate division NC10 bacterium]
MTAEAPQADPSPSPAQPAEQRVASPDEVVQYLAAQVLTVIRNALIYSPTHAQFHRATSQAARMAGIAFGFTSEIAFVCLEKELYFAGRPMNKRGVQYQKLADFMHSLGIQQLKLLPGISAEELKDFALTLVGRSETGADLGIKRFRATPHIRAGRLTQEKAGGSGRLTQQAIEGLVASGAISAQEIADILTGRPEAAGDEAEAEATSSTVARAEEAIASTVSQMASQEVPAREAVLGFIVQLAEHGGYLSLLGPLCEHHEASYLHSINVALLSAAQARLFKASPELVREALLAGLLHDIGKLAVPPEILNKPDHPEPAEERIYRRHCAAGAEMLAQHASVPWLAVVAAFEHHLHFRGGGGYPKERRCAQPHLVSQLVALADFYDKARTEVPGLPPRTLEAILTEIRKETLGRFHPVVAAAFPRALQEVGEYRILS